MSIDPLLPSNTLNTEHFHAQLKAVHNEISEDLLLYHMSHHNKESLTISDNECLTCQNSLQSCPSLVFLVWNTVFCVNVDGKKIRQ